MDGVLARSIELRQSSKDLKTLCSRGAIRIGDILTMRKIVKPGVTFSISATVGLYPLVLSPSVNKDLFFSP